MLQTLAQTRFRWMLPLPMAAQMSVMLFMASRGRPAMVHLAPDAVLHFAAYALLTVLSWIAWHGMTPTCRFMAEAGTLTAIAYGIVDEGIQYVSPARAGELSDLAADVAGAVAGLILIRLVNILTRRLFHE